MQYFNPYRHHRVPLFVCGVALLTLVLASCQSTGGHTDNASTTASPEVVAFLAEHCYVCHGANRQKGGIDFESMDIAAHGFEDRVLWAKVAELVTSGEMPPESKPRPEPDAVAAITDQINSAMAARIASIEPEAGRVTLRRLNRTEYNNTIRDLLGIDWEPASDFPPDDSGFGFDNNGDVLTLSPMLAEKYLDAAEEITAEAIALDLATYGGTAPHERHVLICNHASVVHDERCVEKSIRHIAEQAFRRPVTRDEVTRLKEFYALGQNHGEPFAQSLALSLQAILVSPQFLFRIEEDRSPVDSDNEFRIGGHELASRLSYFLWSSAPDAELIARADDGTLRTPRVLRAQVRRMLQDSRVRAFAENFGGQWLTTRNLAVVRPDGRQFPAFRTLRDAMDMETLLFIESVILEDRSILDFIDADYTFLNEALAVHYGIDGVIGPEFQRVTVDRAERGGILTQASVLTVTSYPNRTSPVLRGVWILENILAAPPPPPPADIPPLPESTSKKKLEGTLRERLEKHRADASCAVCHDRIDPLGFGLENFDAIGAWRDDDNDVPIDNSGVLPDGRAFAGPGELKDVILERKDDFTRALAEKMLVYALGRGLEEYDEPALTEIVDRVAEDEYRFSTLVYEIVSSLPFTKRRGEIEAS